MPNPISGAATRPASAIAQNRSAASRVPPSASTYRTQSWGASESIGTARTASFVAAQIRTVNFIPVIKAGPEAGGGSASCSAGRAPLAARSAIRPLTVSDDIVGGKCNTTVSPAGSASNPAGITNNRSNSAKARDRAGIAWYLG